MNVLFLTFTYPTPELPQAGVFVVEHARAAARVAGVGVVHLDRGGGRFAIEEVDGAEFPTVRVRYPRSPLAYPLHFLGAWLGVRRLRRRGFRADLIHAHIFLAALPPLLLRPLFRLPVVVTEQWSVFLPEDPLTLSPLMMRAARVALRRAARVMPASDALRRGMEAAGIDATFETVPNVVDTSRFRNRPRVAHDGVHLLFVGLLYEAKGLEVLLDALALARRSDPRLDLELVGDGPLRHELETRVSRLGLDDAVTFRGQLPKARVADRMGAADLFVLTSRYDNNPCALIEAQASGLPAVATRVGGIPEIVEDGGGVLAEPDDPVSIADALVRAASNPSFDRDRLAARAAERYSVDAVAQKLGAIYRTACAERRAS